MANYGYIYRYDSDTDIHGGVMTDIFRPDDFAYMTGNSVDYMNGKELSDKANKILSERLLDGAREIFVTLGNNHITHISSIKFQEATHSALLIDIQELKPKVCDKHEPVLADWSVTHSGSWNGDCRYCGVKIKAAWTEIPLAREIGEGGDE